jgi:hypothetical protein
VSQRPFSPRAWCSLRAGPTRGGRSRPWRIYGFRLTGVELPLQIALGTFPLEQSEPDPNCTPATALRARGEDGGLLFVFEYGGLSEAQKDRFPRRLGPFELSAHDPVPYECFGVSYLIRWREPVSDRVFQAHIYGPRRWVEQALGILDSVRRLPAFVRGD